MSPLVKSILFISFCSFYASCVSTTSDAKRPDVIVKVSNVKVQETDSHKEYAFIAKPYRLSELSFRVGGPIERLDLYAGTHYKKGDVIASIDPRDFRINKERSEAVYRQAKAEFERVKTLYEKSNLSASTYEKARAEYTATKANYESAVYELSDTRLIAPFNGYIEQVYLEKHQEARAGEPVVSLVEIDQLKIEAYVSENIAINMQNVKEVSLRFDAEIDKVYKAKVVEISKSTTQNNLSYLLTALLPNKDGKLLAGMSGKIFFEMTPSTSKMAVIPQVALSHRQSVGDYVWVVDTKTNKVSRRKISCGDLLPNGMVSVMAGLKGDETLALSSLRFLSEGMQVGISNDVVR
ncbi:MAG: efflux RND transporter periplasmic adaptor subunit [Muribaculaceae bacterium]